jgi:hypothetical protein
VIRDTSPRGVGEGSQRQEKRTTAPAETHERTGEAILASRYLRRNTGILVRLRAQTIFPVRHSSQLSLVRLFCSIKVVKLLLAEG